jgi:hypothetical protein
MDGWMDGWMDGYVREKRQVESSMLPAVSGLVLSIDNKCQNVKRKALVRTDDDLFFFLRLNAIGIAVTKTSINTSIHRIASISAPIG